MAERTEAEIVSELTRAATIHAVDLEGIDGLARVVKPVNWDTALIDIERHLDTPRRALGSVKARTAEGFIAAVTQRAHRLEVPEAIGAGTPVIYADEEQATLVAVLNDDWHGEPGWRDHRVELALKPTPAWKHWREHQGLRPQLEFAEAIEAGMPEIREPDGATMLEIAETFFADTTGKFKTGNQLRDGRRQLVYEENIDASAGRDGALAIPEKLVLGVAPFFGSPAFRVEAKIRYRVQSGILAIGYFIERPEEIERQAFLKVVEVVGAGLPDAHNVAGAAPAQR